MEIKFQDYIYRVVKKGDCCFEQKLKARLSFSKPDVDTAIIELEEIDETSIVSCR